MIKENIKSSAKNISREEREDVLHRAKAREIVSEIMNFGVHQSQIIYIIRMLALELENVKLMNDLNDVIVQSSRFTKEASSDVQAVPKKTRIYT
jgi:acyl-CoA synthetase (AMP-forming)/AMP-acid ligase II